MDRQELAAGSDESNSSDMVSWLPFSFDPDESSRSSSRGEPGPKPPLVGDYRSFPVGLLRGMSGSPFQSEGGEVIPVPSSRHQPFLFPKTGSPVPKTEREVAKPEAKQVQGGEEEEDDDFEEDFDQPQPDPLSFSLHGSSRMAPGKSQNDKRRLLRNQREQRRSKKITNQIDVLRDLLKESGRPVKPNKASILSETATLIRDLQSAQERIQAAHVALQRSTPSFQRGKDSRAAASAQGPYALSRQSAAAAPAQEGGSSGAYGISRHLSEHSYRLAFHDSSVPMAIATMDGYLVDCNKRFLRFSGYQKEEIPGLTIFNLTAPADLQGTFSRVAQMLRTAEEMPCFEARAIMKHNREVGYLSISLVRDEYRRPIYFSVCITETPGGDAVVER